MSYGHQIINKKPQSHAVAATALPLWLRLFAITAVLLLGCSSSTTAPGLNAPDQGSGKDGIKDDKIAGIVDNRDLRQTVTLQQITRKLHKQEFTTEILEQFKDTLDEGKLSPPVIDILLVIDDSGSMSGPQAKLSTKLEFLLEFIKQMNWQINVITTDNPCPTTPDLPLKSIPGQKEINDQQRNSFKAAVVPGTNGNSNEVGLQSAIANLKPAAWSYKGSKSCPEQPVWIRKKEYPAAKLAVIFVTDDENYLPSDNPKETRPVLVKEMLELLTSKGYAPGKDAQFFGIFWPEEVPRVTGDCHASAPSAIYQDLVTATKGKYGDICEEDYSKKLTEISKAISTMVESKIPLTKSGVIPSTIHVTEDEFVVLDPADWRYDGIDNSVAIKGGLKSGATYEVTYKIEEHRNVALEAPPSESTIKVTVAGQRLGVDDYVYKAESQSLFFRTALAEDKKVAISFRDDGALLKEFVFPNVGTKQISCSLNDQELKYLYFPSDSVIAFQPALEDGQKAVCRY